MSEKCNFVIKDGTLLKYNGEEREVIIPSEVKRIAPEAFMDCKTVEKVVSPIKLVRLGNRAFYGCDNLKEVLIPGALFRRVNAEKIFSHPQDIYFRFYASAGLGAEFDEDFGEEWDELTEPASPEAVNDGKITGATTLLVKVEESEEPAPEEPALSVAVLPEEVEEEDDRTLQEKIEAVTPPEVPAEEISPSRRKELLDLKDFLIEDTTLVKYIGTAEKVEVPEFITRIGDNAFSNSSVTDVYIPEGVRVIGSRAFTWCERLTSVALPSSLELIDDLAFSNCSALKEIDVPQSVKFIGESAFHACSSLEKVILPDGLAVISRRAFDFCVSLSDVVIPRNVVALNDGAFSHCGNLRSIRFPSGLKKISAWAFADCVNLTDFEFPESLEEIGDVAFMNCRSLKRVEMPEGVKRIGRQCFVNCTGLILILMPEHLRDRVKAQKVFQGVSGAEVDYI